MVPGMTHDSTDRPLTDSSPVRLRPERPPDVLDLIPILLGFHPAESLVLVVLHDGRVELTARVDLGDSGGSEPVPGASPVGVPPVDSGQWWERLGERMAEIAVQHGATGVVLVSYAADPAVGDAALRAAVAAQPAEVEVVDAIRADRHRWWSLLCPCADCAGEGTPYEPGEGRLAAEAVYAGVPLRVFADREQKEATVRPPDPDDHPALLAATATAAEELAGRSVRSRCAEMVSRMNDYQLGSELDDAECARLAVLADTVEVRDAAWALFTRTEANRLCELWGQVVRRTVAPYEKAPLCLLGLAGWLAGDGALQVMCFERALAVDPNYSLARLLERLNDRAVPPSLWDELAEEVRAVSTLDG